MKVLQVIPWIVVSGLLVYIIFFTGDSAYKELSDRYKQERDQYMEISITNIKRADSLQKISVEINKDIDSLKKVSKQYDNKLIAIKKYYEKKYADVSNNTPSESYLLFTEYTSRRFPVSN